MVAEPTHIGTHLRPEGEHFRAFPEAYARHAEYQREPLLPAVSRWRLMGVMIGLLLAVASVLVWRLAIQDSLQDVETILEIEHRIHG